MRVLLIMFLLIFSYADEYVTQTKELIRYKLNLKYDIKDPMVDVKAFNESLNANSKNLNNKKDAKYDNKVLSKDKAKVLNSTPTEGAKKKGKKDVQFTLKSIFNNKAFITAKLDDNTTSSWYKENDSIFYYKVYKIDKNYVIVKDKNVSKMLVINKADNKNLKVVK